MRATPRNATGPAGNGTRRKNQMSGRFGTTLLHPVRHRVNPCTFGASARPLRAGRCRQHCSDLRSHAAGGGGAVNSYGSAIFDNHQELLAASAISVDVARARGYVSADTSVRVAKLGFKGQPVPGLLLPVWGPEGEIVSHQYRPDVPQVDATFRARKYLNPAGQRTRMDFHPFISDGIRDATVPLWITEGLRKVDAAITAGCPAIVGLSGVWNWRYKHQGKPAPLPEWEHVPLDGRHVTIAYDSDTMVNPKVANALNALGSFLADRGAAVHVVYLPDLGDGHTGIDDFLASGKTWDDCLRLVQKFSPTGRPLGTDRPELDVTNPADAADVLRREIGTGPTAGLFARSGNLVSCPAVGEAGYVHLAEPGSGNFDSHHQIRPLTGTGLAAELDARYWMWRRSKDGSSHHAEAPASTCVRIAAAPHLCTNLRTLEGVSRTPFVRPDFSICFAPGYDVATGVLLLPAEGCERIGPERLRDAKQARATLLDIVSGFPFNSDDDRATYLAALMWPLMVRAIGGTLPLVAISAHQPGSGKSLLASVLRILHDGTQRSEYPSDKAEAEKELTSILSTNTGGVAIFDNCRGLITSGPLESLLTTRTLSTRKLGTNDQQLTVANDRLWCLTGNNLALGGDLRRRTVWVSIDPDQPQPENRTGFSHPNLEEYVTENRGQIVAALLTLIAEWNRQGRPYSEVRSDTFADAIHIAQGVLNVAGIPGIVGNPLAAPETGGVSEDDEWGNWYAAIWERFAGDPFKAADLHTIVTSESTIDSVADLAIREQLPAVIAERVSSRQGLTGRSLGIFLQHRAGRWFGDHKISVNSNPRSGNTYQISRWEPKNGGTVGLGGTISDLEGGDFPPPKVEVEGFSEPRPSRKQSHQSHSPTVSTCAICRQYPPKTGSATCVHCQLGTGVA